MRASIHSEGTRPFYGFGSEDKLKEYEKSLNSGGSNYESSEENKEAPKKSWLDKAQTWADVGGFIPGIGVGIDLLNSGVSLGRAAFGDPERRSEHLANAAMSGVAAIPGLDYIAAAGKGASKLAKANKARKGIKIPLTNTKAVMPSSINPLKRFKTNPVASTIESGLGVDYALSEETVGGDKDRTSYMEKALTPVVTSAVEGYMNLEGDTFRQKLGGVIAGDGGGNDTSTRQQSEPVVEPVVEQKKKPVNYDRTGSSNNKKLRKIQESRGYFRDK